MDNYYVNGTSTAATTWDRHILEYVTRIPDKLPAGRRTIGLPDGSQLEIDDLGNYQIQDQDAKVIYRANRIREFSPHLNASDMLAEFVKYAGGLGVRRADVLHLPLHLFVAWLVIEAAERDGDELPADIIHPADDRALKLCRKPQCLACGRYIPRLHYQNRFQFCGPEHAVRYSRRIA